MPQVFLFQNKECSIARAYLGVALNILARGKNSSISA